MTSTSTDSTALMALAARYGELDGEIVYYYAVRFAAVGNTLTSAQRTQLTSLISGLGYVHPTGAFLYSESIAIPEFQNTDFLFQAK